MVLLIEVVKCNESKSLSHESHITWRR